MKLEGKRVLITGGSSGIGLAIAHALLAKGAKVAVTGRRPAVLSASVETLRASGGSVTGIVADVGTEEGRAHTLRQALDALGGLDILINNAGGVRAGRLETTSQSEIETMLNVDLLAPILLTRAALPSLRASGGAMVVNVTSGIALIGAPLYATYAAAKAGLARFGEALRRELKGEGVHVLTVYPGGTDTPMMKTNRAGSELGFGREPASAVADATIEGIKADAFEVIRGGETRAQMIALNRDNPAAIDERMLSMKPALEEAVKDRSLGSLKANPRFRNRAMIDLYYWPTPNGHKITLFLEEAGLDYTIKPVNISAGDQFDPTFLAFSPNNRMPAIIDHDPVDHGEPVTVFESGAILLYLAEKTGLFLPTDLRGRKTATEWLFWQMGGLGPMAGQNHHFGVYAPEKIPYAITRYVNETNRLYGVINRRLADRPFLAGEAYTIADMAAYPWVVPWKRQQQNLDDFANVRRWFDAIAARPATQRAYARGEPFSAQPAVTEEGKKLLFGQTAACVATR